MNNDEKRGAFLKELRKEKNLTQQELGNIIHYSDKAISKWEQGKTLPNNPKTLDALAKLYDVTIDELLYGERINKDNQQKIIKNMNEVYINHSLKLHKIINIILVFFIISIILGGYLIYHFYINGNITFYKLEFESEHFRTNGSLLLTKSINTLNFSQIEPIHDENINFIELYYMKEDSKHLIFENSKKDYYYIEEYSGYNEYNLQEIPLNDVYIKINYDDNQKETIKLDVTKRFINDKIFYEKNNPISTEANNYQEDNKDFLDFLIKEKFYYEDGDNKKDIEKGYIYYANPGIITVLTKYDNYYEMYNADLNSKKIVYDKINSKTQTELESNIYEIKIVKEYTKDKIKTKNDIIEYISYLSYKYEEQ